MASTLVGGAFLSASVQILLEKMTSNDFRDFLRSRKLKFSLLEELETTLLTLQVVLDDAEEKQFTKPAVKEWIDKLKDAVFDAEDLLGMIEAETLRCKMEEQPRSMANQVRDFLSSPFNQFYRDTNFKIEDLSRRLKQFAQQKDILRLQSQTRRVSHRTPTSSLVNESVMVGRDKDIEKLVSMLLSDDDYPKSNNIGVVTILGMGGVGKTTLAQLLFNDKRVQEHFDLKAWTCVSEDFDAIRVTKTLLQSSTSEFHNIDNFDFLQVELKKRLMEKKFLFVLDDLWNDNYNDWDNLQTPFSSGKKGSKIIITTRQLRVAEVTHTFPIHELHPLSNNDCWCLLAKHAFGSEESSGYPILEAIGRKIARKCGGLPIAAKTVGGVLRAKLDDEEWKKILNSNVWDLHNDDVIPALRLSYFHLPAHLKRCFAYCSIFPKDYPLDRKQLVLLWMAEGFVQQPQKEKMIEDIGNDYFDELLSRSLVQQYGVGNEFVMHDLVNDLATVVSGQSCFRIDNTAEAHKNVRHLSYNQEDYDICKKFENIYRLKFLRSFLPFPPWGRGRMHEKVLDDLLPTLLFLRVLSLSGNKNITKLPNSIGRLVQLRYLDLSYTRIEVLPETVYSLYNLQTLILSGCNEFRELSPKIGKLVNLRHLDISGTNLEVMPTQVCELQNLQTLTYFIVGKHQDGLRVKELRKFGQLQGKLSIKKLHNVIDAKDAFAANLKGKEKIEELVLEWGQNTEDSRMEKEVMSQLEPSLKLRKLTINLYGGTSFPNWLGDSSFSNMVFLNITNCDYCLSLPPLGQLPSLKNLTIVGMLELESIGAEFYGEIGGSVSSFQPFPSLEHMKFQHMPNWKEWLPFECEGRGLPFPRLESLRLAKCPKLRGHLPNHLPSLNNVTIVDCYEMEVIPSVLHWISSIKILEIGNHEQWFEQEARLRRSASLPSLPKIILTSNSVLQDLTLFYIPSLTSFPTDGLPTSLRSLYISGCAELAFPPPEICRNYTSLVVLSIYNSCESLVSFSLDCFPALEDLFLSHCANLQSLYLSEASAQRSSRLKYLSIRHCKRLKSLPERMDMLTALRELTIIGLPELESFPKGGLTPNLNEPLLLPTSLLTLCISDLSDMKSLEGNWLQRLTSLKELHIENCKLLESLPEDKLPPSLSSLDINECPVLEARYQIQSGEHRSKIAHIPVIRINNEVIM